MRVGSSSLKIASRPSPGSSSPERVSDKAYPDSLNAEQFVTRLDANAGRVLTDAEMAQLEALFGGPNASSADAVKRAQVVRSLAENQNLQQREFNRAFVLTQYFGYLRRNPDDGPDTDYTGYDFWLTKLDQFGGNYINAEMVKAFIYLNRIPATVCAVKDKS